MFLDLSNIFILNEKEDDKDTVKEADDIDNKDSVDDPTSDDSNLEDDELDASQDNSDDGDNVPADEDPSTDTSGGGDDGDSGEADTEILEKMKKKKLNSSYVIVYKLIGSMISDMGMIPGLVDEDQDKVNDTMCELGYIKDTMYDYITNNLDKNTYPVNLYNLYQFKQSIVVSSEILQKIKEFKKET